MAALPSPLKVSEPTGGPMAITSPMRGSSGAGGLSSALAVAGTQFHPFPHDEITLRFMYRRMDGNDEVIETIHAFADQTIRDIKLELHNQKGWFNDRHVLVCGGRELHDSEIVGQVAQEAKDDENYLHLLVRPQDILSGHIRTDKQSVVIGDTASLSRTARLLAPSATESVTINCDSDAPSFTSADLPLGKGLKKPSELESLTLPEAGRRSRGPSAVDDAPAGVRPVPSSSSLAIQAAPERAGAVARAGEDVPLLPNTVLHLRWPKSSRVTLHASASRKAGSLELSVTRQDTAESVRRKLTAAAGRERPSPAGSPWPRGTPVSTHTEPGHFAPGSLSEYTSARRFSRGDSSAPVGADFLVPVGDQSACGSMPVGTPPLSCPDHALNRKFLDAQLGLSHGYFPELAEAGTGGSYFLRGANGERVAVFKPEDEEPAAPNNPKGTGSPKRSGSTVASGATLHIEGSSSGLRRGTVPGEGAVREVAAYLLDHRGFAGVPATALVSYCKQDTGLQEELKRGSLQEYIHAEGDCEEYGYSNVPVAEVHKIAVLDLRLANADRNGGNILRKRHPVTGALQLVPIDHGYCLPASFEDISFEWLYWPQAEEPFSEEALQYISELDAAADLRVLSQAGLSLRPDCQRVFKVCTAWLKLGASAGLTPFQIGSFLCRETMRRSGMERLVRAAADRVRAEVGSSGADRDRLRWNTLPEELFLAAAETLMEEWIDGRFAEDDNKEGDADDH